MIFLSLPVVTVSDLMITVSSSLSVFWLGDWQECNVCDAGSVV